jgi:FkbM family methyltransferase
MKDLVVALEYEDTLQIMDVGASVINEIPIYRALLDKGVAHLHAFDGDDRQIAQMKHMYGDRATIHNAFLFDGSEQKFYLCSKASGMSSVLRPKTSALRFFNGFEAFRHVEREEIVFTKKLDNIQNIPQIDFLKMDVQGCELSILKNGGSKLHECMAIQLEISFVCLYEGQPSFGEIDLWMRQNGFIPHKFVDIKNWSISPSVFNNNFRIAGNQLLEADIIYVRNPLVMETLTEDQLKVLSILSHYCFHSFDLCGRIILELEERKAISSGLYTQYLSSIPNLN